MKEIETSPRSSLTAISSFSAIDNYSAKVIPVNNNNKKKL